MTKVKMRIKPIVGFSLVIIGILLLMPYIRHYFQNQPSDPYASISRKVKDVYVLHLRPDWDMLEGNFVASDHAANHNFYYFIAYSHYGSCLIGFAEFKKTAETFRIYCGVDLHTNMVIVMNEEQEETRFNSGIFKENFTLRELNVHLQKTARNYLNHQLSSKVLN